MSCKNGSIKPVEILARILWRILTYSSADKIESLDELSELLEKIDELSMILLLSSVEELKSAPAICDWRVT